MSPERSWEAARTWFQRLLVPLLAVSAVPLAMAGFWLTDQVFMAV